MKAEHNQPGTQLLSERKIAALRARFEQCKTEIAALDWISEGSVSENNRGPWRWTRKVRGKTVSVALSQEQASAFEAAIANHRRLEHLIREMRAHSQTYLLDAIAGPARRKTTKELLNPA